MCCYFSKLSIRKKTQSGEFEPRSFGPLPWITQYAVTLASLTISPDGWGTEPLQRKWAASFVDCEKQPVCTEKNGFDTATKLGTTNEFFVAPTKNFATTTKRFLDRTIHFVVVIKYFCYPYFNKWLCWYNKTFFSVCQFGRQLDIHSCRAGCLKRNFRWNPNHAVQGVYCFRNLCWQREQKQKKINKTGNKIIHNASFFCSFSSFLFFCLRCQHKFSK